jgi:hypothetical protein
VHVTTPRMAKPARVRNPAAVLGLTLVTFGIYNIVWWHMINRELKDLGVARGTRSLGTQPTLSTIAYTIGGWVYVPLIWTIVTTNQRVRAAQRLTMGGTTHKSWIAWVLWILTFYLGGSVYLQMELNRVWRSPGMIPLIDGQPVALSGSASITDVRAQQEWKLDGLLSAGAIDEEEHRLQRARYGFSRS